MMTHDHTQRGPTQEVVTATQRHAWLMLRRRYQEHQDLFTARELAYLRFLRWLVRSERLAA